MKQLTIALGRKIPVTAEDLLHVEKRFDIGIPGYLKEFMLEYGGCRTKEVVFQTGGGMYIMCDMLYVREHEFYASMEAIYAGHVSEGLDGYIPFATDPGGWDFNVSIRPETYGQVWLNMFSSGEEDTMAFVCSSFAEFIDGLTEEE